jgi:hypothetical protein
MRALRPPFTASHIRTARLRRGRTPSFEPLEPRLLMSAEAGLQSRAQLAPFAATAFPTGFTPQEIRRAYGFDAVRFANGTIAGDGRGQTIALVDAYDDPRIAADLAAFDQAFGLPDPPSFRKVNQQGGTAIPPVDAGWSLEIALDVEWAHAMAPAANLLLVEASSNTLADMLQAVNFARWQPGVSVVSMSWGGGEFSTETNYESFFTTPPGHAGVAFVASSGDYGQTVLWPSVSPNVLAVGGTHLSTSLGGYGSETPWSGSGGGASGFEPQPTYQAAFQTTGRRTTPDVSFVADPATGVAVYDSLAYNGQAGWLRVGGTSVGAPQWAALVAIADQGRALAGRGPLNGVQANIYQLPGGDFHVLARAGANYDTLTGRGTPIAPALINDLLAAPIMVGSSTRNWDNPPPASASTGPASIVGNTLTLARTSGADSFSLSAISATMFRATVGSFSNQYNVAQVNQVVFKGSGASTVMIGVLPYKLTAVLSAGSAQLSSSVLTISIANAPSIYVYGKTGDAATMTDLSGGGTFTTTPAASSLQSGRFLDTVSGFSTVTAQNTGRFADTAYFYSSGPNDQFVSLPNQNAYLTSPSMFVQASGFAFVYAYHAGPGGSATLYAAPGNATFVATALSSYMTGGGYFNQALGFQRIFAISTAGSVATAYLYDAPGPNRLVAQGNQASLTNSQVAIAVTGFARVNALGGQGDDSEQVGPVSFSLQTYGKWKIKNT